MKKILIFLFLLTLSGCSSDDDKNDNSIIGTWWLYESYTPAYDDTFDYRSQNKLLIFDSDGEYERWEDGICTDDGTYKQSGNEITLYDYDGMKQTRVEISIRKIDSDNMELNWTYVNPVGEKDPHINRYKRKL